MTKLTVTTGNKIFARLLATRPRFLKVIFEHTVWDFFRILEGHLIKTSIAMCERIILTMFAMKNMDHRSISLKYDAGGTISIIVGVRAAITRNPVRAPMNLLLKSRASMNKVR